MSGCSRSFYRQQADSEVYCLVDQVADDPRWPLEGFTIDVDPRSRMYDPFNTDCPPMPEDDPTSHILMHCVDCKNGYPCWHAHGDTSEVENPNWMQYLPLDSRGRLHVSSDDAVRTALLHSRRYQAELEELYLSALDVTFERFRFDAQFFGGFQSDYYADGRIRSTSAGDDVSVLGIGTFPDVQGLRMRKMYATGTELVVGLANSLIWQFSGPNDQSATTLLDFALVQPLLRAGGRDRVMERLTISERALLANVRQMERFRRGFYVDIMTGEDEVSGPSRRGGFFGGSGLEGFSGVGGGGFGRVGGSGNTGNLNAGFAGGAGAAQASGYIGLLQSRLNIQNQESNIASLRSSLAQLEAFFQAGRIDYFQKELARQAMFNAQSLLLTARTRYDTDLDRFKRTLGLPPELDMIIDDSMLGQFNLIDTQIVGVQHRLAGIQEFVGQVIIEILSRQAVPGGVQPEVSATVWNNQLAKRLTQLQNRLAEVERIREQMLQTHLPQVREEIHHLNQSSELRRQEILRLQKRFGQLALQATEQQSETLLNQGIDPSVMDVEKLNQLPLKLEKTIGLLIRSFSRHRLTIRRLQEDLDRLLTQGPRLKPEDLHQKLVNLLEASNSTGEAAVSIPDELLKISTDVLQLSLTQASARTESIMLVPVELSSGDAVEIARDNRRDWMNARSGLVDAWRLIEFNADSLESSLDIVFSGDISNTGDNPFQLRDTTGRLRAGIRFDAPLTRLSERNTYRQALIEYQQARRTYYSFQDRVSAKLRETLRTIDLNQINFEIRRAAVHVAISQVELAQLSLQKPPDPEKPDNDSFEPTTARNLVSALSDLLNVQNDFLSVWVDYEVQRRKLDLDLGTMQLDSEGIWVDPGTIHADFGTSGSASDLQLLPPTPELEVPERAEEQEDFSTVIQASYHDPGKPLSENRSVAFEDNTSASATSMVRLAKWEHPHLHPIRSEPRPGMTPRTARNFLPTPGLIKARAGDHEEKSHRSIRRLPTTVTTTR